MTAALDYEDLWYGTAPAARRLAGSLVPEHAADDVVSEAFTRVISSVQRGGGPRQDPRPYVMAAVRNQAYDYRSRGRRLVPVADAGHQVPVPGPEHVAERREEHRLILRAFRQLPERWQRVLWATAVEEHSAAELAQAWGMAPNTISQLASRAREGLRQAYLNEHAGTPLPAACRAVAPYLGAAVRGHAGRRHQAALAAHLRQCNRCAAVAADLTRINTGLGELLVPGAAGLGTAAKLLTSARGVTRLLRWHTPLAAGLVATLAGAASLVVVATVPPAGPSHLAVTQAAAPVPAAPAAPYQARHRQTPPGGSGSASSATIQAAGAAAVTGPAPAASTAAAGSSCSQPSVDQVAPWDSWPAGVVQQVGRAVDQVPGDVASTVSGARSTVGTAVSSTDQTVGQAVAPVTGAVAGVAPALPGSSGN